jgi:hypothetical protein
MVGVIRCEACVCARQLLTKQGSICRAYLYPTRMNCLYSSKVWRQVRNNRVLLPDRGGAARGGKE